MLSRGVAGSGEAGQQAGLEGLRSSAERDSKAGGKEGQGGPSFITWVMVMVVVTVMAVVAVVVVAVVG